MINIEEIIEEFSLEKIYIPQKEVKISKNVEIKIIGLELIEDFDFEETEKIYIFGKREISYLKKLPQEILNIQLKRLFMGNISFVIWTESETSEEFLEFKNILVENEIPLLSSTENKNKLLFNIMIFINERFVDTKSIPGTMMEVYGMGILMVGESGIGKSECALELIKRGHRLISDDVVTLKKRSDGNIYGISDDLIKHHMEIRGIGIIDVKALFGIAGVIESQKLDFVIQLETIKEKTEFDRLGLVEKNFEIFNRKIPKLIIPVKSGRNMSIQVEVAALNEHLKFQGHHSAKLFMENLFQKMKNKKGAN